MRAYYSLWRQGIGGVVEGATCWPSGVQQLTGCVCLRARGYTLEARAVTAS